MKKRIIRLCYRKVIDVHSTGAWERMVFEDSYQELRMQFQYFDPEKKHSSFTELVLNTPSAEKLHFLVSAAVTGYVRQLNERVPDILNNLGKHFLTFQNYQFEIINSDIHRIDKHQIALVFYTGELEWHETIADQLIVSAVENNGEFTTDLLQLKPFLSIYSLKLLE